MKFLLDENVSQSVGQGLRDAGHDAVHIRETDLAGASDEEVMGRALAERRIIITHDKDFGNVLRFRIADHAGVVLIRLRNQNPDNTLVHLRHLFAMGRPLAGRLVIVRENAYRIIDK